MHCVTPSLLQIVPVTDILRAQQIQEDNEVQQTQQSTILQRFKSVSIGNLLDLPGEDDKKSIKNRMRMKCKFKGVGYRDSFWMYSEVYKLCNKSKHLIVIYLDFMRHHLCLEYKFHSISWANMRFSKKNSLKLN